MNDDLNREIAFKVVLPKLKKLAMNQEFTGIASMRKAFNDTTNDSVSAQNFQNWIDLLGIKFTKKVVITWPGTFVPDQDANIPEGMNYLEEEEDEMTESFPPSRMDKDAFGLLNELNSLNSKE